MALGYKQSCVIAARKSVLRRKGGCFTNGNSPPNIVWHVGFAGLREYSLI